MGGWHRVALSEIVHLAERSEEPVGGIEYRQIGVRLWGQGAYERESIDGSQTKYSRMFRAAEGDIIVNKIWARNGSVAVVSKELDGCYASGEFPMFAPDRTKLLPGWFHWFTKSQDLWRQCDEKSRGTSGKNRIRPERFLEVTIPLPPLAEQQRIVARIDALAARIEEAKGLRAQAVAEVEAVMGAIIAGLQVSAPDGCLIDVLVDKPRNGWSVVCDNDPQGIAVLTLSAVTGFFFRRNEFKTTSASTDPVAHYWLSPGDLLITRSNTPELVGHAAIYPGEPYPCIYPDLTMRLQVNERKADRRFLWYWLRGPLVRDFIRRKAKGTSPTMKKISQKIVMEIPFPTQLSMARQQRIVARLDDLQAKVDAVKRLQAETQAELNALLPAVLDRAFRGEVPST